MNFMLPVPLASLPAVEICWTHLAGGHQHLRHGDPVILQKYHLQLPLADGVVVHLIRQRVDETDDALGYGIAGSGLGAKEEGLWWEVHVRVVLQLLVQGNDVQYVQQLPFILVKPLHLHVEDSVRVQLHPLLSAGPPAAKVSLLQRLISSSRASTAASSA